MSLWICTKCTAAYAVGLAACPQCAATEHTTKTELEATMPKATLWPRPEPTEPEPEVETATPTQDEDEQPPAPGADEPPEPPEPPPAPAK